MGCSTSDIEIQAAPIQFQSPIGKLEFRVLKFEFSKNFHLLFKNIINIKFSVSNQKFVLCQNEIEKLLKCNKNNPFCFQYVINSLKKRYGRLLMIELTVEKNGQLIEITEIIDINPIIKFSKCQKSQTRNYLFLQKQCIGMMDLSLAFYQKPSSNILLQIIPHFKSQIQNQKGQIKFTLTAGQQNLQKTAKLNENNHKKIESKIQIPHFLSNMILKAQYIDENQKKHYSSYEIFINAQALNNAYIQRVLDLTFSGIPSFGKLIVKQTLVQKYTQNTTNSSKQIVLFKKIDENKNDGTTNPSINKIETSKQIDSIKIIQGPLKSPKKILLPPIQQADKQIKNDQNKFVSQNNVNILAKTQQIEEQQDMRKYEISLKCIPVI